MEKGGYQIRDQSKPHFMTFTVVDWGGPTIRDIFTRKIYRDIIIESMKFCQKQKGLILYGFVIMSNHIHVIFQAETGDLSDLVRDFKVFTAKKILETIPAGSESRSDWMLKRFESGGVRLLQKVKVEIVNINFGNMAIIQKKYFQRSFYGLS
jgi:REP element-mobilizing transposase RayT